MLWHAASEPQPGRIVNEDGRVLGEHPGIEHFTIGQRKGLRLGGGSEGLVVHQLVAETNTVVVAPQEAHPVASIQLGEFNNLAPGLWQFGEGCLVRARYNQQPWPARVFSRDGQVLVEPEAKQYSLAQGQWLVGYRDDVVLFGGVMNGIRCH